MAKDPEIRIKGRNETQKAFREVSQSMQAMAGQQGLGQLGRAFGTLGQSAKLSAAGLGGVGVAAAALFGAMTTLRASIGANAQEFQTLVDHAKSLGIVVSGDAVKAVTGYQTAIDRLTTSIKVHIAEAAAPYLAVLEAMVAQGKLIPNLQHLFGGAAGPSVNPVWAAGLADRMQFVGPTIDPAELADRRITGRVSEERRRAEFDEWSRLNDLRRSLAAPGTSMSPISDLFLPGQEVPRSLRRSGGGPRGMQFPIEGFVGPTIDPSDLAKRGLEGVTKQTREAQVAAQLATQAFGDLFASIRDGAFDSEDAMQLLFGIFETGISELVSGGVTSLFGLGRSAAPATRTGVHQRALRRAALSGVR